MKIFILALAVLLPTVHGVLEKPTDCGSTVGCYSDCTGTSCDFVVTWVDEGNTVLFTLSKTLADPTVLSWVALGFSNDIQMGDDSVSECTMGSETDIQVFTSYNLAGKNNVRLSPDPKLAIVSESGSVQDGVLTCTFQRSKVVQGNSQVYDLNTPFYLLVANGQMLDSDNKSPHSFTVLPSISPRTADLQSTEDLSGSVVFTLVKVHGCLMVFAWVFCASIGIVFARFFKPVWPAKKLLSEAVWFTFHRVLMVLTCLTCIAAFVVIFVFVEGWSTLNGSSSWQQAHPYIGTVVTGLVILNPLMAIVRPHPEDKNRPIFNYLHWMVGFVAHGLSMVAMLIGVNLSKASVPEYVMWILVGFVGYQILMVLLLEVTHFCGQASDEKYKKLDERKDTVSHFVKKAFLGLHVIIITGFTVAIIVLIAIN